mmetsp:Transcript_9749/g.30265  ORF Transcript_9749/g.30265 Transcript_9749/m.30265 type:complete len:393 (-) Transcript_9749:414-1592(-)
MDSSVHRGFAAFSLHAGLLCPSMRASAAQAAGTRPPEQSLRAVPRSQALAATRAAPAVGNGSVTAAPVAGGGHQGCCFAIGSSAPTRASKGAACCLRTEHRSRSACFLSRATTLAGGVIGWRPKCPRNALQARAWIREDRQSAEKAPAGTPIAAVKPPVLSDHKAPSVSNATTVGGSLRHRNESSSKEECLSLPNHTRVGNVLDMGSGPKDASSTGAFGIGTILEVSCAPGFNGSERSWELNCSAGGVWRVRRGKPRPRKSGLANAPDCMPTRCERPFDPLGTWQGRRGYNQSLHLVCADGYAPAGGTPVLFCDDRKDSLAPAHCVPGEGSAQEWRSRLRYHALISLLADVIVVVVVVAACWREPMRAFQPSRPEQAADRFVRQENRERDVE